MRVENSLNQNNNGTKYLPNKKQGQQKEEKRHTDSQETLELSNETRLLNKLLIATENKFIPFPFYFVNAAAKNLKLACEVSKKIQNQAQSMGYVLNYTMIYEMVVDMASQNHLNHSQWNSGISIEQGILSYEEKNLLESLHSICVKNNIPTNIIETTAQEYVKMKNLANQSLKKRQCVEFIIRHLKAESMLNNNVKSAMGKKLKQYVKPPQSLKAQKP